MSLDQDMSILSGREIQEQLLKTNDTDKRVRLLVEHCIRQQQEMFYLNKKLLEVVTYLDKIADSMVNVVSGTSALAAEVAPLIRKSSKNLETNKDLTYDN